MLCIAKILKSNGTDGGILIGLTDILAEEIELSEPVFITFDGLPVPFFITDIQPKGSSRAIIHLSDVSNLKDAEEIVGRSICIEADEDSEEEEDFTGWTIYDRDRYVGVVTGFEDIPGNPCICIGEDLIPLHEDFILEADPSRKTLTLDLPEGLI